MNEEPLRKRIVRWGKSLFDRGLTAGSSGNITVRTERGFLATPTNSCLGFLEEDRLSELDANGNHLSGDAPTKELPLHFALYRNRREARAVVHLHSTYATALSCLADIDPGDALPAITPYAAMRVGRLPLVPYTRPGAAEIVSHIDALAENHTAVLLQNHGPVVSAPSLESAIFTVEELEEAAKLAIVTRGMSVRLLDAEQIADLDKHFKLR